MSTRPQLAAERRAVTGKKVARLRRDGQLPAVVYGHDHESQPIQLDARAFDELRRHAG
ncbi:MAG: 50S ribosomal protein L25, partial [Chloroflexi bacterium]|nr:50S ribosomal protein L25 [Chloroflexota bacterium]